MHKTRLAPLLSNKLLLALAVTASLCTDAWAVQLINGVEGENAVVKVSLRDFNRISIQGEGQVRSIKAADDSMITGAADAPTGQALIRPLVKAKFGVLVFTTTGKTYSLVLDPQDIPSESIVIREPVTTKEAPLPSLVEMNQSTVFEGQIKSIIREMAENPKRNKIGMEEKRTWQEIKLWDGVVLALERTLKSRELVASQYHLVNLTDSPIVISEQEFFKKGVLAVSIRSMNLGSGESTQVFIIERNEVNE